MLKEKEPDRGTVAFNSGLISSHQVNNWLTSLQKPLFRAISNRYCGHGSEYL